MTTLVFDVNETLLSLRSLQAPVAEAVGTSDATSAWFARLLHASLVANHLDDMRTFEQLATTELQRIAAAAGRRIEHDAAVAIAAGMRHLEPHPDVVPGLHALAAAGHRLTAFTNGSSDAVREQLEHAAIDHHFDAVLSVDQGTVFKPHRDAYAMAARLLDEEPGDLTMVAAHDWDIAGARRAGLQGVFVERNGPAWHLPSPQGPTVRSIAMIADVV